VNPTKASKRVDIVGVGVAVWDVTLVVDALPESAAVVQANQRHVGCGGGVAVAMATAAKLGCSTALLDSIGDDALSKSIASSLSGNGVNAQHLQISPQKSASVASVLVQQHSGERTIVFSPGNSPELQWVPAFDPLIASAKVLHLNGRHLSVCRQAICLARQHNVVVSYDGGAHRYRDEIVPLLNQVDVLIVAEHFARAHHQSVCRDQTISTEELASFLQSNLGCDLAGVTVGSGGSYFCDAGGNDWHQPAHQARRVLDTTGCGDVFHGAFLSELVRGQSYASCAEFASKIAAKNAEALGALAWEG